MKYRSSFYCMLLWYIYPIEEIFVFLMFILLFFLNEPVWLVHKMLNICIQKVFNLKRFICILVKFTYQCLQYKLFHTYLRVVQLSNGVLKLNGQFLALSTVFFCWFFSVVNVDYMCILWLCILYMYIWSTCSIIKISNSCKEPN